MPGSALKKNPTIGKSTNSKGWNNLFKSETSAGLGGLERASMNKIISSESRESVKIAEDTWGKVLPRTVREKSSFMSGGKRAPTVMANQFTGQRK